MVEDFFTPRIGEQSIAIKCTDETVNLLPYLEPNNCLAQIGDATYQWFNNGVAVGTLPGNDLAIVAPNMTTTCTIVRTISQATTAPWNTYPLLQDNTGNCSTAIQVTIIVPTNDGLMDTPEELYCGTSNQVPYTTPNASLTAYANYAAAPNAPSYINFDARAGYVLRLYHTATAQLLEQRSLSGQGTLVLDIGHLPAGMYYYTISQAATILQRQQLLINP